MWGRIAIRLADNRTNAFVPLDSGDDRILLEETIRIAGETPEVAARDGYVIGDRIDLRCAAIALDDETIMLDVYWRVDETPRQAGIRAFVHALDGDGALVTQIDRAPLAGRYPPELWRPGQTLVDRYELDRAADIESLFVGLYLPDVRAAADDA